MNNEKTYQKAKKMLKEKKPVILTFKYHDGAPDEYKNITDKKMLKHLFKLFDDWAELEVEV